MEIDYLKYDERKDLSKIGLYTVEKDGKYQLYVPLSQYLKAILFIENLEKENFSKNSYFKSGDIPFSSSMPTPLNISSFTVYTSSRI